MRFPERERRFVLVRSREPERVLTLPERVKRFPERVVRFPERVAMFVVLVAICHERVETCDERVAMFAFIPEMVPERAFCALVLVK